ncbi:hypothetical protein DPV78_009888 [Talaromyces pinophilus]|nr:hypothetical protein DPV78_009888 [Talaromyces pinophilus]
MYSFLSNDAPKSPCRAGTIGVTAAAGADLACQARRSRYSVYGRETPSTSRPRALRNNHHTRLSAAN